MSQLRINSLRDAKADLPAHLQARNRQSQVPVPRLRKPAVQRILGLYLPSRFGSGKPFHGGLAWDAMDLGLKVMARILAK